MKKLTVLAMVVMIVLTGCNTNVGKPNDQNTISTLSQGELAYPIETDVTLTYWVKLATALGTSVKNLGETPFAQEYIKRTGINVKFNHPAQGQETEALNLLLASNELPDIIETNWLIRYPDSSIASNTILRLNDIFKQHSPHMTKYLSENADIDKTIKTDSGNYYVYPFVRSDEILRSTSGYIIRSDWLNRLGMDVPATIDEWDVMLRRFKDELGSISPMSGTISDLSHFAGAFGIANEWYVENGKIQYGSVKPEFKKYLQLMHDWYANGLIDKNFAVMDGKLKNSNMLDGKAGATFGAGGGTMGMFLSAMKDRDENYDLVAAPFPTQNKGERSKFGNKNFPYSAIGGAAITGQCKNPEIAARFLDYSFTEDGYMLNNFGIEGESYRMENGYPKFTEIITDNPNGLSMAQAIPLYARSANEGPFVQDKRYIEQYYTLQQQRNALEVWAANDGEESAIPQLTLTKEEMSEFNNIMTDLTTYKDEMRIKYIIGTESLDNFDSYTQNLRAMGIERAIAIQQQAYDRFLARK